MFERVLNIFENKQAPEDEIKQVQAEVDSLSAAALNPGTGGGGSYNEHAVKALKKAQTRLEVLQGEIKKRESELFRK
jgi:hypothetical protein